MISALEIELAKLDESLAATPGTLAAKTYEAKRARLHQVLDQRRAELAVMPGIERELKLREADIDVAQTAYEAVARDLKDAEIKSSYGLPDARLISPAGVARCRAAPAVRCSY